MHEREDSSALVFYIATVTGVFQHARAYNRMENAYEDVMIVENKQKLMSRILHAYVLSCWCPSRMVKLSEQVLLYGWFILAHRLARVPNCRLLDSRSLGAVFGDRRVFLRAAKRTLPTAFIAKAGGVSGTCGNISIYLTVILHFMAKIELS